MEFVGKPIFAGPVLMEFVGKPIFPDQSLGIRGQANFTSLGEIRGQANFDQP